MVYQVLLAAIQGSSPFTVQVRIVNAFPVNQEVHYCAPDSFILVGVVACLKGVLLIWAALLAFTTRG